MSLPHKIVTLGLVLGLGLMLAACSRDREVTLTRFSRQGNGPDEFAIVPGKPLQPPASFSELPPPQPGAPNLTDPDPLAEGVAALGGNIAAIERSGIPPADAALVRQAARFGTDPAIRQILSAEDEQIRRAYGRRNLLRIGPRDDYTEAYKRQWLDEQAERERLRRLGIKTPSAPPPPRRR